MTKEVAEKIVRGITDKIECNTVDIDDWAEFWGFTREEYEEFLDMAIKALEQQLCEDCISREEAVEVIAGTDETNGNEPVFSGKQIIKMLKDLPSVTPKTKTGRWEDCSNGWMCSNCYKDVSHESDFCPNCGTDMRGEDKE